MVCTTRQLTQAQLEAGYDQQRTGVVQALRPFGGEPTVENLIDYVNRELCPAVRSSRAKVNEVFKQVADNAPSANPLAFYFSTTTTNADPTAGRIRLDQAVQNTATVLRVSQSNARLQDVAPWLDVMSGGPTTPLGCVTLLDAVNPGRFLRFDLNTMVDQGLYWDLGVTLIESSDASPFVDGEAAVISFIAGVSAAGSTIPVGALSPVARDTFLGNIGTTTVPPSAVPLANIDGTSVIYDGTSHSFQRAALTGDVTAAQDSNATTIANGVVTNAKLATMAANTVKANVTAGTAAPTDHPLATLAGASLDYAAGVVDYVGSTSNVDLTSLTGAQGVINIATLECGGCVTVSSVSAAYSIAGFTAKTNGYWFDLIDRRTSGTTVGTLLEDSGATTTSVRNPEAEEVLFPEGGQARFYYFNNRWRARPSLSVRGRLIARTTYASSSGTHTYDTRCRRARVRLKAGGGGGAGAGAADGNVGGGGGEGGYEELDITTVPATSAYAVGAAGSAGSSSSGTGGTGGDTTFNDGSLTRTASGGAGGIAGGGVGEGGNGGAVDSIGGTVSQSCRGAPGMFGFLFTTIAQAFGGNGGGSGAGKGGFGTSDGAASEAGVAAGTNSGAGGGGGARPNSPNVAGGAGGAGWIVVEEFS